MDITEELRQLITNMETLGAERKDMAIYDGQNLLPGDDFEGIPLCDTAEEMKKYQNPIILS